MRTLKTVVHFREYQGLLGIELETIHVMFWKAIWLYSAHVLRTRETELKSNGPVGFEEDISRHHSIQVVSWLLLTPPGQVPSERGHREDGKVWKAWFDEECSKCKVLDKQGMEKALWLQRLSMLRSALTFCTGTVGEEPQGQDHTIKGCIQHVKRSKTTERIRAWLPCLKTTF